MEETKTEVMAPEAAQQALIWSLANVLAGETLDDAMLAYKYACAAEKAVQQVKSGALALAAQMLQASGREKYVTPFGTCGFTNPNPNPAPKVDAKALLAALDGNPELRRLVEPFLEQPKPGSPSPYIR